MTSPPPSSRIPSKKSSNYKAEAIKKVYILTYRKIGICGLRIGHGHHGDSHIEATQIDGGNDYKYK